jgi:hypothetical protein
VRGADLVPLPQMQDWLAAAIEKERLQYAKAKPLLLGAVLLPEEVSRRHIFVAGTSGTGKSVCLNHYIPKPQPAQGFHSSGQQVGHLRRQRGIHGQALPS